VTFGAFIPFFFVVSGMRLDANAIRQPIGRTEARAALVGAGALSTLAGPLHGLHVRRKAAAQRGAGAGREDASREPTAAG
jgi:hypothetical protein